MVKNANPPSEEQHLIFCTRIRIMRSNADKYRLPLLGPLAFVFFHLLRVHDSVLTTPAACVMHNMEVDAYHRYTHEG